MNVADKALLYAEARRVLADGSRLAVWDIVAGGDREPDFPVPWADRPEYSHLTTCDRLRTAIGTSGFEIEQWNDLTGQAAAMMQTLLTLPPSPIGLQAFVPGFASKATNLTAALADGRLRAIQGIARAALRRVAIRSGRRRTMTSKIVVGELGALTAGGATVVAPPNFPDEPAPRARRTPARQPVTATDDERPCSRCKGEP
jgi:hypothetical protein